LSPGLWEALHCGREQFLAVYLMAGRNANRVRRLPRVGNVA